MSKDLLIGTQYNSTHFKNIFEVVSGKHVLLLPNPPYYTILAITDDYCLLTGLSRAELIGKNFFVPFPPNCEQSNPAAENILRTSLERVHTEKITDQISSLRYETKNHSLPSHEYYWSFTLKPIIDEQGEVRCILLCCSDVTDKVKFKQLESNRKRFEQTHNLFLQSPIAILILKGIDLVIELVNDAAIHYLQKGNDVTGKSLIDLLPEIKNTGNFQLIQRVMETEIPYKAFNRPAKLLFNDQEELKFYDIVIQPYYEQGERLASGVLIFASDVTEGNVIKAELQENKQRADLAIEIGELGIYTVDLATNTATYSSKIMEWFSLSGQHATLDDIISRIYPDDQSLVNETIQSTISDKRKSKHDFIYRILDTASNSFRYFRSIGQVQYSEEKPQKIAGIIQDVTEQTLRRKHTEENESRLNHLANAMPQVVWIADASGKVTYYNHRVFEFQGARKLPDGTWMLDNVLHPDDKYTTKEAWLKSVVTGSVYECEHRILMRDDQYRWHLSRAFPQHDQQGNIVQWFGTTTDIHQQKIYETQLQENEEHLTSIFSQTSVGIAQCELNGKFMLINERYCEIVGRSKEELEELNIFDITHPDDVIPSKPLFREAAENGVPFKIEKRYVKPDGTSVWVNMNVSAVKDVQGKPLYILGVCHDVTEKRIAEQALQESEERFRTLANDAPLWVWMADELLTITYVNTAFIKFVGLDPAKGFTTESWGLVIHAHDLDRVFEVLTEATKQQAPYEMECRFKNASTGEYEWFHMKGVPRFHNAKFSGFIGTGTSIQAQKNILQQLETRVKERTRELNFANRALQQSNEDLQQFAHVASHDLKEPIRKIKTFWWRIEDDPETKLSIKGKEYFLKIRRATERMASMVEGVLNYSTANAAQQPIEQIDLNDVFRDIESDLELLIHQNSATIQFDLLPKVEGAPVLIYQLFYNLLNNSLKFAKKDVPLFIEVSCSLDVVKSVDVAVIHVKDNGIGFEPEHAENIFNTFARLHPKDKYEGTGLGLSLCKKIAQRHRGSITARGQKGVGAEFKITLPLVQREPFV